MARDDIDALLVDGVERALDLHDELRHRGHGDRFAVLENGGFERLGRVMCDTQDFLLRRGVDENPFKGGPNVVGFLVGVGRRDEDVADSVEERVGAGGERAK